MSAGGPSTVPVMTKTFSSTLAATELLLLELLGPDAGDALRADLLAAADAAETRDRGRGAARRGARTTRWRTLAHLFVTGGGLAYPAALEAALKLKEMALVHAEGAEVWEMTSGAATMLGPGAVVIALAPDGPAREAVGERRSGTQQRGAPRRRGRPRRPRGRPPRSCPFRHRRSRAHASLTAVPPVALLAFALARRARRPTRTGRAEIQRYHSQGLRHILGAE